MVNDKEKQIYIFDEFYQIGMLNGDIYRTLKKKHLLNQHIFADSAKQHWHLTRLIAGNSLKDNQQLFRV